MPNHRKSNASSRRQFLKRGAAGVAILGGIAPFATPADALLGPSGVLDVIDAGDKQNASRVTKPLVVDAPSGADLALQVMRDSDLRNHPDVLAYLEFSSAEQVLADLGASNWYDFQKNGTHRPWYAISNLVAPSGSLPAGASFPVADPEFIVDRGLSFMRFSGGNLNQRLISAFLFAGKGIRHAFARYVLVIEPDVALYMTELGVKLPGFNGDYEDTVQNPPEDVPAGQTAQTFSWRMEHGPQTPSSSDGSPHPPFCRRDYLYDGASGAGFGNIKEYGGAFPLGVPITIEQELDVDNQVGRVWVDGVLIGMRPVITNVDIEHLWLNVYHGGLGFSTQPIHYRLAAASIATSYIGVPRELRTPVVPAVSSTGATPAWRLGLPVGQWVEIPGTSLSKLGVPSGNIDAWCGLAALDDATSGLALWVSAAAGGHVDSNDNGVYGIDWLSDAPSWEVMCAPSPEAMRVSAAEAGAGKPPMPYAHDGKPNSCHTYWSLVWSPQSGRIFRPFSSALWYAAQGATHMDGFDPLANRWDAAGTWPDCPITESQMLVAADPATGDIYVGSGTSNDVLYRWTQATNGWSRVAIASGSMGYLGYEGGMVDATRNWLVRAGYLQSESVTALNQLPTLDLATGVATVRAVSGLPEAIKAQCTIIHDTENDRYYLTDSVDVYGIDPQTMAGTPMPSLPIPAVNGAHSRFAYFAALGAIAYYPGYAQNVWFMATE
ncbi:MAG TPA: twin-arginine translocation signal domain-containing protein [Casimicrobiaceae bacterium]|nr:twin-arginine translocation signal domain-containing protein [Casimicrobiaceae bacterium]